MREQIVQRILTAKIVAIIRVSVESAVGSVVENVITAGLRALEITSNTPDFCGAIQKAKDKFPQALIGAGTITDRRLAKLAINCGSQFLVTPNTNVDIIPLAHEAGIPVLMGALTPTEIATALEHEADFIKLFPASVFGPEYLKALIAPFSQAKFFAVGGVNASNAYSWIGAGACGVGVGGSITEANTESLRLLVPQLLKEVNRN